MSSHVYNQIWQSSVASSFGHNYFLYKISTRYFNDLLVINDFQTVKHDIHYKHIVVNIILPDIYFAPSNVRVCVT